jgi:acyl-CoA thioesterase
MFDKIRGKFNCSPYYQLLGMKITNLRKGYACLKVPFNKKLEHIYGGVHGGVLASAGDAAVGAALATLIHRDDRIATIELKINYITPIKSQDIFAEGRILSRGNRIAVGEIKILTKPKVVLVGVGLATYRILHRLTEPTKRTRPD